MTSLPRTAICVGLLAMAAVACLPDIPESASTETDDSELRALRPSEIVGSIAYGETKTVSYTASPRYRALSFEAKEGDEIEARFVGAKGLDTVGFLLSSSFSTLKQNDDESATSIASRFTHRISKTGTYYLAVREANGEAGDIAISLSVRSATAGKSCSPGHIFVQGTLTGDVTWDKCEVVILDKATVPAGSTLTILPGVVVTDQHRNDSNSLVEVEGVLSANGTKDAPIVFKGLGFISSWLRLSGKGNMLENVVFEGSASTVIRAESGSTLVVSDSVIRGGRTNAYSSMTGIYITSAEVTIRRSLIEGFNAALWMRSAAKMVVEDTILRGNERGIEIGINFTHQPRSCVMPLGNSPRQTLTVTHSDIVDNDMGVYASEHSTGDNGDLLVQLSRSNIVNNGRGTAEFRVGTLAEGSFVRDNNIYALHRSDYSITTEIWLMNNAGSLDLSNNYWSETSVKELLQKWRTCGAQVVYQGFASELIPDAGPRETSALVPLVEAARFRHSQ